MKVTKRLVPTAVDLFVTLVKTNFKWELSLR